MKTFLLISLTLFFSLQILGQSIYSGIWGSDDYHYDFNPDTNLYQPLNYDSNILEIDLNEDGTNDFKLTTLLKDHSQWGYEERVTIEGLNQNQVAYSQLDTCLSNDSVPIFVYTTYQPLELYYNELINNDLNWTDSIVNLSYNDFDATYPTNMGYSCSRISQFQSDTGYIAVRIIDSNDTLYGWIKISNVNFGSCMIHEYACNKNLTLINSIDLSIPVIIYPNPSNGFIEVKYHNSNNIVKNIKAYNTLGQLKKQQFINGNEVHIDLTQLSDGLYLLHIETMNGNILVKKIIIKKN